jgi:hypothetical protein
MANGMLYIHEHIDITLQNRAKYIDHMTRGWGLSIGPERPMLCFGVWATVGSTERWPEATNMWELPGWEGMAENFRIEFNHPTHQDPTLIKWWSGAAEFRSGGYDRLLIPAPWSPTLKELIARGVKGEVYHHETIRIAPGQAKTYLDLFEQHWLPVAERIGLQLVGAYRTAMTNDSEVIVFWAMKDWDTWADVEIAYETDERVAAWRARTRDVAIDWRNKLLSPAPLHPLHTGRQPGNKEM